MTKLAFLFATIAVGALAAARGVSADDRPAFRDLFNGKDLSGWVAMHGAKEAMGAWTVRKGVLVSSGRPEGYLRTEKPYENFLLHVEWRHVQPGGDSGLFIWSDPGVPAGSAVPRGLEVQILDLDWINLHKDDKGNPKDAAYVHGEIFGTSGLVATPDNPRGARSKSVENRCKGHGEWNSYDLVAVDGAVKLAVNGVYVNGVSRSSVKKGHVLLESAGSEIHFRNIRILELGPSSAR